MVDIFFLKMAIFSENCVSLRNSPTIGYHKINGDPVYFLPILTSVFKT